MKSRYQKFTKACEICGKTFSRSTKVDAPPRFCCQACKTEWQIGVRYEKHVIGEEWYPRIQKMYVNGVGNGEVRAMARRIGVPQTKVTNLARSKGWIPKKHSPDWWYYWCDRELEIVEKTGHCAPITVQRKLKAAGFLRSVSAIEVKRSQLRATQNRKGMTADGLAQCMGVDCHNILSAINKGRLKAQRRPGFTGERVAYMITDNAARSYIKEWLPEINLAYCDKYWLIDLMTSND